MDNLIFSLNATVPVFLMMLLGMVFRKIGLMDREFAAKLNRFVFQIALPVVLFQDLAGEDFSQAWDFSFVAFCFLATLISILVIAADVYKRQLLRFVLDCFSSHTQQFCRFHVV